MSEKPDAPKPPAPKSTEMENTTKQPKLVETTEPKPGQPAEYHEEPGTPKPDQS